MLPEDVAAADAVAIAALSAAAARRPRRRAPAAGAPDRAPAAHGPGRRLGRRGRRASRRRGARPRARGHLGAVAVRRRPRRTSAAGSAASCSTPRSAYGADAAADLILSTEARRAMRRYAPRGLDLRPCVAAAGIVDRAPLPAADGRVEAGGRDPRRRRGRRAVRGAGHGLDLPVALDDPARRCSSSRTARSRSSATGAIVLLAASTRRPATRVLGAALAATPPGATVSVDFLTGRPGLGGPRVPRRGSRPLPDGPVFAGGDVGPLAAVRAERGVSVSRGPTARAPGRNSRHSPSAAGMFASWTAS